MSHYLQFSFLTTLVQAVGVLFVALLLLPLTRAMPARFLQYWGFAWTGLTVGLACLTGSFFVPELRLPFLVAYCLTEYLFGFLLWAGFRDVSTGRRLAPRDFLVLVPLAVAGVAGPVAAGDLRHLFPAHAVVMAGLFLAAVLATRRFPVRRGGPPTTGLWMTRVALGGLAGLFAHYAVVAGYVAYVRPDLEAPYLAVSSLYDVLLEMVLAFGMVLLATDRFRDELEAKNVQLAAAAAELAHAARTDALTGLLNRRAFDELTRDAAGGTTGSLAVIDLNDLKPLNDSYGHALGDVALQLVARSLRVHFRVTDPLFRTGGDEFVVVMLGCSEADLTARMEKVDESLVGQRLPGVSGTLDLRVSWGVAGFARPAGLPAAFQKADAAMYACKKRRKAVPNGRPSLSGLSRPG